MWEGKIGTNLMGIEFQFHKIKRVMEMGDGGGCKTLGMYSIPLNCTQNGYNGKFYVMCTLQ